MKDIVKGLCEGYGGYRFEMNLYSVGLWNGGRPVSESFGPLKRGGDADYIDSQKTLQRASRISCIAGSSPRFDSCQNLSPQNLNFIRRGRRCQG